MRFGIFTSMGAQTWSGVLDLWRHLEAHGLGHRLRDRPLPAQHQGARRAPCSSRGAPSAP